MTIFFVVSYAVQALSCFVIDRFGPQPVLFGGLILIGVAAFGYAVSTSYGMLAGFAVVGDLGNGVFHPVDYTLLNSQGECVPHWPCLQRARHHGKTGQGWAGLGAGSGAGREPDSRRLDGCRCCLASWALCRALPGLRATCWSSDRRLKMPRTGFMVWCMPVRQPRCLFSVC